MNRKMVLAMLAMAVLVLSCNRGKHASLSHDPLVGKWTLDSVSMGKDSNIVYALLLNNLPGEEVQCEFRNDTLFIGSDGKQDTTLYQFDPGKNQFKILSEVNGSYFFNRIADTMLVVTATDSTILFLRRQ